MVDGEERGEITRAPRGTGFSRDFKFSPEMVYRWNLISGRNLNSGRNSVLVGFMCW